MKKAFFTLLIATGFVAAAHAGDAEKGKQAATDCAACHLQDGNSAAPNFPKIAGQGERYIVKQLQDMKDGVRMVPEMVPFVSNMSQETMEDLAAYFSSQTPTSGAVDPEKLTLGERIFRFGNEETGVAACAACHGPSGQGVALAGYPMLAGQHAAYTEKQLKAFSAGSRMNDGDAKIMRTIAYRMHEDEMKAVASYIEGLSK